MISFYCVIKTGIDNKYLIFVQLSVLLVLKFLLTSPQMLIQRFEDNSQRYG